jgi:hypothetical protein
VEPAYAPSSEKHRRRDLIDNAAAAGFGCGMIYDHDRP